MATVRSLTVSLNARTAKFRKGMKRAGGTLSRFSRSVKRIAAPLGKLGGIASLVAGGGLTVLIKRQADAIDAMSKLSDRIGITTEDLAGLQLAAEITGAGTELMNRSLDVMSKRLGEAAQGSGEAKAALEVLGLTTEELLAQDPAEQFRTIADRIAGLSTQAEKAAVTSDLFSRAGLRLLNTLELGRGGLDRMKREAQDLGVAFSRIEGGAVEQANDALNRMKLAITGVVRTLTIGLSPLVTEIADSIRETIAKPGFRERILGFIEDASVSLIRLSGSVRRVVAQLRALEGFDFRLGMKGPELKPRFGPVDLDAIQRQTEKAVERLRDKFAMMRSPFSKLSKEQGEKFARDLAAGMLGIPVPDPAAIAREMARFVDPERVRAELAKIEGTFREPGGLAGGLGLPAEVPEEVRRAEENWLQTVRGFSQASSGILTTTLSDAITDGIFRGFGNARQILEGFGEAITRTVLDAFLEATVGAAAERSFRTLFASVIPQASTLAGQGP